MQLSRRRIILIVIVALVIAVIFHKSHKEETAECLNNMKMIWGASVSHLLENKLMGNTVISMPKIAPYLKGGVAPKCPKDTNEYASFVFDRGPRCPNSAEHSSIFVSDQCAYERACLWDMAISYGRRHHLAWDTKVDRRMVASAWSDTQIQQRDNAKLIHDSCPLATNDYPAFRLSEGPVCPSSPPHTANFRGARANSNYFDRAGNVITNRGL